VVTSGGDVGDKVWEPAELRAEMDRLHGTEKISEESAASAIAAEGGQRVGMGDLQVAEAGHAARAAAELPRSAGVDHGDRAWRPEELRVQMDPSAPEGAPDHVPPAAPVLVEMPAGGAVLVEQVPARQSVEFSEEESVAHGREVVADAASAEANKISKEAEKMLVDMKEEAQAEVTPVGALKEAVKHGMVRAEKGSDSISGLVQKQLEANPSQFGYKGDPGDATALQSWAKLLAGKMVKTEGFYGKNIDMHLTDKAVGHLAVNVV
ncbi:MAG: hypothetical protein UY81_C0007G0011, partial [Candidatus Giovannonibacteria bacterium GW2011_GWA2_53_7]